MALTREEKVNILMAQDIVRIKDHLDGEYYSYLCDILTGGGWTQYDKLTDEQIDVEFKESWSNILDDDDVQVLALAHKLNGKPIDFLKI